MNDRDHFAAAALTGLLKKHDAASPDQIAAWWPETACAAAYRWADAMLRERSRTVQKLSESDSCCAVCPERDNTNHDAAPAAKAEPCGQSDAQHPSAATLQPADQGLGTGNTHRSVEESSRPRRAHNPEIAGANPAAPTLDAAPAAKADSRPLGNPVASAVTGTGKQPAPPCVETDRPPCDMQSPAASDGSGRDALRDVPQQDNCRAAGGPEHHISEAEIDALEFVVKECRIANIHDYGILRSMLIRLRQEWEFRDSPEPIAGCDIDRSQPIRIDLSQPCMVDPPSGWKWGFPRRYDPASDGPMNEWLVRNGYPKHLADKGLPCTFTLCGNQEADK